MNVQRLSPNSLCLCEGRTIIELSTEEAKDLVRDLFGQTRMQLSELMQHDRRQPGTDPKPKKEPKCYA